jgi:hypothetical protein
MLKCLFTEPFDVTSTGLITCGAGIKHVTTGHTLRELTRVLHTCLSHSSPFLFIAGATSGTFRCFAKVERAQCTPEVVWCSLLSLLHFITPSRRLNFNLHWPNGSPTTH